MEPVTVADQPAVLDPADADELIGTLLHAAAVIGALAGGPDATRALGGCPCSGEHDITALWWDLQLTAADIAQAATAGQDNTMPGKESDVTPAQKRRAKNDKA
jgi:hypothetical protein